MHYIMQPLVILLEVKSLATYKIEALFKGRFTNHHATITSWLLDLNRNYYHWLEGPIIHLTHEQYAQYLANNI
jgi:hypothetical protein